MIGRLVEEEHISAAEVLRGGDEHQRQCHAQSPAAAQLHHALPQHFARLPSTPKDAQSGQYSLDLTWL